MENETLSVIWPDADTPYLEQAEAGKKCLDYAIARWHHSKQDKIARFKRIRNSYLGRVNKSYLNAINNQYGVDLKVKFTDYRLSSNKLDTLVGEFQTRKLNHVIYTTNKDAVNERIKRHNFLTGIWVAQKFGELDRLKKMGFDPLNGMPVPKGDDPSAFKNLAGSNKAELYMQKAVNEQLDRKYLKTKLTNTFRDLALDSECHFYVNLGANGDVITSTIRTEDYLGIERDNDDFGETSLYDGRRVKFSQSELYQTFTFNSEEKPLIKSWFSADVGNDTYMTRSESTGELLLDCYHLEWTFLEPFITKRSVSKYNGQVISTIVSADYYERNKKKIDKEVEKGAYEIEIKYKEFTWEGWRIGNSIYKKIQKKQNAIFSWDDPFPAVRSYINLYFNTQNGMRISVFEAMEDVKHQYNLVRWQINRELSKAKGTIFTYDESLLPIGKDGKPISINKVISNMVNDGFMRFASKADGNLSGKNVDHKDAFQVLDLTPSSNLITLVQIAQNLEALIEKVSSVNNNREGNTKASETATNAQSDIILSRTITEPLFYFFDCFIEKILHRVCEYTKISWILFPERAVKVLGVELQGFIEENKNMRYNDYNAIVLNSRKEEEIKRKLDRYTELTLNARELPIQAAYKAAMKDTILEMQQEVEKGWMLQKDMIANMEKQKSEAAANQQKIATDREDFIREDEQAHDMEKLRFNADLVAGMKTQDAANKAVLKTQESKLKEIDNVDQ
jgi:hypothetical protein